MFSDWDSKKNPTTEVLTLFIKYEGIIYSTCKERARKKQKGFQLKKKKRNKRELKKYMLVTNVLHKKMGVKVAKVQYLN